MSIATCLPGGDKSSKRLETGVNSGSNGIKYLHASYTANQIGTPSPLPETVPNAHCSTSTGVLASPLSRTEFDASRDGWTYDKWLHEFENEKTGQKIKKKHLALTWLDLTVNGIHSKSVFGDDIISYVNPMEYISPIMREMETRPIIRGLSGQVRPGEMMLVLGRPGSGCSTFLKAVANKWNGYESIEGEVFYGSMSSKDAHGYKGTILYNSEEDVHFPTLSVAQTVALAVKSRAGRQTRNKDGAKGHIEENLEAILRALGISHTYATPVGNEFIRGVSGGERKRVSLSEVIAAQSSVTCWDNPTRGLDASSALEFNQTLRTTADTSLATVITTLYQAGNGIFDLYDKVLVLDDGRQIYYGPRALAKKYFEEMGFICPPGANVADFLTSVTVKTERQIRQGFEELVPASAAALEAYYNNSHIAALMKVDTVSVPTFQEQTSVAISAYLDEQPKHRAPFQSAYIVSLYQQIISCTIRQLHILNGDKWSMGIQQVSAFVQAIVSASLYYDLPETSTGTFTRTGALFFPIVLFNLTAMAEVTGSYLGRPILARHRDFSLYRPTAYIVARMITDIPVAIVQTMIFSLAYYFMCGFQMDGAKFFTFWLLVTITALTLNAQFRMIGFLFRSFDNASKISGLWTMVSLVYAGYFIPYQNMHPWFRWIFWLSPPAYAYEAIMGNEFGGLILSCVGAQLIPNGPGYDTALNRACTVPGATSDGLSIIGADYIHVAYNYEVGNLWRDFGILVAWWIAFTIVTAIAAEMPHGNNGKSTLVYSRGKAIAHKLRSLKDAEKDSVERRQSMDRSGAASEEFGFSDGMSITRNEAVFTWENLSYTVPVPGGHRKLLDEVSGWVKPGTLGALMGSSGAGKTTLLDVLAQRKDTGVIEGTILVDGRALPVSFQRSAGYCEQMDVHEGTATVREALLFSARLRQAADTPDEEKLQYVDSIINLLELNDLEDAVIGIPGAGLNVEQRKRVTIGVELAAKPSILLFLDEPTSGLDGQSAFNVIRFLRRLTAAGQAVLCTIHQPSASLFEAFDTLLLLSKGGKTVYFGDTGLNSTVILDYFERNGAPCGTNANPAEHIINVVSGESSGHRDWNRIWLDSADRRQMLTKLAQMKSDALAKPPTISNDAEDFATSLWTQIKIVTHRQQIAVWRNPEYVWNKIVLHITSALFGGFTFWKLGESPSDLQLRLLAIFNFLFVAVGIINQLQPLFLHNRDIFEAREKKAKMYSWLAFVTAQLVAELPYLLICGFLYFACFYFTAGLPVKASVSGQIFLVMILYEFLYTAVGQAIAAISPNDFFAALLNPLIIGAFLINFAGVLVPYDQIVVFWKYWMYYLDPFTYLIGALLTQLLWEVNVVCKEKEMAQFTPPPGQTCGQYMEEFFKTGTGYIFDNSSTTICEYCPFKEGSEFGKSLNLSNRYDGWKCTGIVAIFCTSTYGFVFLMMKLRSKKTKSAKSE